jgi:predicted nucleotidyltransferase
MGTETGAIPPIAVELHEWEELAAILRRHLPGRKVWAFGSRATGQRMKRFSDLDLAVDGEALTLGERARLAEALEESALPFKVDVVELATVTPEFRTRIEPEFVPVQ